MGTSIGSAALVLSTNSAKLFTGLSAAGTRIQGWAASTSKSVTSKLSGLGSGIGKVLSSPLVPLAGLAAGGLSIAGITENLKALTDEGKRAASLGIASDTYMGLTKQLEKYGISGEEAGKTIAKLGAKATEAAQGNQELNILFTQLGLSGQELVKMPLDKQFIAVADAISKVPNEGQQAALAMKLFEEGGTKALGFLQKGGPAIQKSIEDFKKLGVAVGQPDMDKLLTAQQSFGKLGDTMQGIWNKATIAAAPFIEVISDKLSSALLGTSPLLDTIATSVGAVFEVGVDAFTAIGEAVGEGVKELFGLEDGMNSFSSSTNSVGGFVKGIFVTLGVVIGYVWDVLRAGIGIVQTVAGAIIMGIGGIIEIFKEVVSLAKSLPENLKPSWLNDFVAGTDKAAKAVQDFGLEVAKGGVAKIDAFGSSAEKVFAWDRRTEDEKLGRKRQTIDKEPKAVGDLIAKGLVDTAKTAFASKGSMEDYSIQAKFQNQDIVQPMTLEMRKQQELQREANAKLEEMLKKLDNLPLYRSNQF